MMKVTPFETYQSYLSMKSHFTNRKYDFFRYGGKSRATIASFNKRKDKYWFEKTSRKYPDKEIVEFLVSNFVSADNPQSLWIGEIMNSGEKVYSEWSKTQQSLGYIFKDKITDLLDSNDLEELFNEKINIVDIGASPLLDNVNKHKKKGEPEFSSYQNLMNSDYFNLICVEGHEPAYNDLKKLKYNNSEFLNYVVGNGSEKTFNICKGEDMSSLLIPSKKSMETFSIYKKRY